MIDSHVHFWRRRGPHDIRIIERIAGMQHDFMPEDLKPLCQKLGVDGVVVVEAAATLAETRDLLDMAEVNPFVRGVVGWVDLASPDCVAALAILAARPAFVGVRVQAQETSGLGVLETPAAREGLEALARHGRALDLLVTSRQLGVARQFIRGHSELRIVVNHCGRPLVMTGDLQPWADDMRRLARGTGAVCKLSGLIERALFEWRPVDVEPYVLHLLDCFGPERLMFASNWPVSNLHGTYARWWEALAEILDRQGLGVDDRQSLFETTAVRAYRLPAAQSE